MPCSAGHAAQLMPALLTLVTVGMTAWTTRDVPSAASRPKTGIVSSVTYAGSRPSIIATTARWRAGISASSAGHVDLNARDVLADLREDLAAQPVVLLVRVVHPVSIGVCPVIGDRETPAALAQPQVRSHIHREHSWKPERGDTCQALLQQRGIRRLLSRVIGLPQAPDHDVADHECSFLSSMGSRNSSLLPSGSAL